MQAVATSLELEVAQRRRVVWRLDGGAGSDDELLWLFAQEYHVMAKGMSNRRAHLLAQQVQRWDPYGDYWLGEVSPPRDYGKSTRCLVKRRLQQGKFLHSYYISSLAFPSKGAFMAYYDARGAAEIEQFRNDKSGLAMAFRRKRRFAGQQAYLLLTDLAHNLLADFHRQALLDSRFADYGLKRIIRDFLATPGRLIFDQDRLVRVEILSLANFAQDIITCLQKLDFQD